MSKHTTKNTAASVRQRLLNLAKSGKRSFKETVIAEKFEAMIKLGELNSMMKDFFDVWTLANSTSFGGSSMVETVSATFSRRGTAMDVSAPCFSEDYASLPSKAAQWRAFLRRAELQDVPPTFAEVWQHAMAFLRPVAEAVCHRHAFEMIWSAGGPWRANG